MTAPEIIVRTPDSRLAEREYVLHVILTDFLGLPFTLAPQARVDVELTVRGESGDIRLPDILFALPDEQWGQPASLPAEPVARLAAAPGTAPVAALYCATDAETAVRSGDATTWIEFDLLGSCFYLLTRYEERVAAKTDLDEHGRFPARSSLLLREQLLERPLVDEYVRLLRDALEKTWPGITQPPGQYRLSITHDIDHPFNACGQPFSRVVRRAAGDILKRRNLVAMTRRLGTFFSQNPDSDPNNTFDLLMDQSEAAGTVSRFHFMAADETRFDSGYDIAMPQLRPILKRISERNHEIGWHPGYRTSDDSSLFRTEKLRLEEALGRAGVSDWAHASRQHYLRWNPHTTWRELDELGIRIDSSVGFADQPGFRCGTSRPFPVFDWSRSLRLELREQPLIVMDATLDGATYMGLDWNSALQKIADLVAVCKHHGSPMTLLWHNDRFQTHEARQQYLDVMQTVR